MSRVCSLGAKIKVIVLDEAGPIVCNRIFHACAKRPSHWLELSAVMVACALFPPITLKGAVGFVLSATKAPPINGA